MNWLDIVIGVVFFISIVVAFRNGFSREAVRLIALVLGIAGGFWYHGPLSVLLQPYINNRQLSEFTAFMAVLVSSLVAGSIVAWTLGKLMGWTGVRWFDRLLGAAFGFVRGLTINAVFILGLVAFTPFPSLEKQVADSRFAPLVLQVGQVVADLAPETLRETFAAGIARIRTAWMHGIDETETPR